MDGRLRACSLARPIPLEFEPLDRINDVYERVKAGRVEGRAVLIP